LKCVILVGEERVMEIDFRSLQVEDAIWIAEAENDPEAARYWGDFPRTEHEIRERLKKRLESGREKAIVAELNGEPAGWVGIGLETGRCRHVAWLGIFVRRKHWGKGVGSALMERVIDLAKQLGCRRLLLGVTEGNERAIRLYKKYGFKTEAYYEEHEYIEGVWKTEYIMGLELAPCNPTVSRLPLLQKNLALTAKMGITVRQLMDNDLDEVYRLQNCAESAKSTHKVPPIPKDDVKRWYEELNSRDGRYCYACFQDGRLLGYLRFRAGRLPSPNLHFDEMIVDVKERPKEAANALIEAIKNFRQRYGYRGINAFIPATSNAIVDALKHHGFNNAGRVKCYYFIDGYYVDMAVYKYP
jgi:ribosomal-protein-alanine N-acetyltransferase